MKVSIFFLLLVFGFCQCNDEISVDTSLENKQVTRKINIASQLVKIETTIVLNEIKPVYIFAATSNFGKSLSFISAVSKSSDSEISHKVEKLLTRNAKGAFYSIHLTGKNGKGVDQFTVTTVYTHYLVPYPAEIKQSEKQFVKFNGLVHYYSVYKTLKQDTTVTLSSTNVLSHTQKSPVSKNDNNIVYGPYANVAPYNEEPLEVHYENNAPFLTITDMTRLIEVSHWGNIAVEETYSMFHNGAKLKGSFSRYEYQRNQDGISSIKSFKTVLPAAARDVYYRDHIGNISTSHLRELVDSVELEIRPRFPLFGGWKTQYLIGYNIPSYEYLYHSGQEFCLQMRFVDHIFDDQVVDQATVKIVLPEGVTDVRLETPFDVIRDTNEVLKTYLDTSGRVVVVAHKNNLVEGHIRRFRLYYRFNQLLMVREPLLVFSAFFALFMIVIIYVRLDFSITKDEASESRMRVAGLVEEVQAAHDKRSALYQAYEDATNRFKASKDAQRFSADRKKIDMDHKALTAQLGQLQTKLRADSVETADKVSELQLLDVRYREAGVTAGLQLAEKLVSGRLAKHAYLEQEAKVAARKEETVAKMDSLLSSL